MTPAPQKLLAVDGDSLAHRAYHGLPKHLKDGAGRPANALIGFANFLQRLWDFEQPDAVLLRQRLARQQPGPGGLDGCVTKAES